MEGIIGDSLCDGKFCKLIQGFDVPPDEELQKRFTAYLLRHGAEAGILVGEKKRIQQCAKCPFCRFVAENFLYTDAPETSQYFARLNKYKYYTLEVRTPSTPENDNRVTFGERIVLVSRSHRASASAGRVFDNRLSYDIVRYWLNLCDRFHEDICPASDQTSLARAQRPRTLRVVDTIDQCLADIAFTERYVALSYVWGKATPPKLYRNQLQEFYTTGSLRGRQCLMPNTIRDAMTFTADLGLRYLWFDSLCLIQDNVADLRRGIMNMDLIYEGAYVTVIAANGSGADSGLPGVGQTSRQGNQQTCLLKPGLEIMRARPLDEHLNKSVWASRGWTMQEQYLSRRTINFVNNQAYFRCRKRIWCEELWTDRDPKFKYEGEWITNLVSLEQESMDLEESIAAPHSYLFLTIERFQQRDLTNTDDAINAMTGILQRVAQKAKTAVWEGFPLDLFPLAVIFLHHQDNKPCRRGTFPSWSWAGWMGRPMWYAFAALDIDEHPEEVGDALSMTCAFFRKSVYMKRDGEADEVIWVPERSTLESAFHTVLDTDQGPTIPTERQLHSATKPRLYEALSVTAMAVYMTLKHPSNSLSSAMALNKRTWILSGKEEHECGYLYLDTEMEYSPDQAQMLLLLSKCYRVDYPIQGRVANGNNRREVFWVMFVIPMEHGVYERRGIGQVLQDCIHHSSKPGPRWTNVILG